MEPIVGALAARPEKKWLILNKVDIAIKEKLLVHTQRLYEQLDIAETFFVSAATGDGLPELKTAFARRSDEHTSELQSLMRISYAVFCLKQTHTYSCHSFYMTHMPMS